MKFRIKKGDMVRVISGNESWDDTPRRVLEVYPKKNKVLVEGVNVRKKHERPSQKNQKGGIISKEMPVDYSNVMVVDSNNQPTRIGVKYEEKDGRKVPVRYAKTTGKNL